MKPGQTSDLLKPLTLKTIRKSIERGEYKIGKSSFGLVI